MTSTLTDYESLLTPAELAELGPSSTQSLPIDLVDPNPLNPRTDLAEVESLADNIRRFGLLQPVVVRRAGERFELLGGHRRRAAVLLLRDQEPHDPRWRVLDAVVRTAGDDDAYLMLLSAQVHNRQWRPKEEAYALERLAIAGMSLEQIAERLNRSPSWAGKRLRTYSDSVLSGFVQSGRLSNGVAEELLSVLDPALRQTMAEQAVAESWGQDHARGQVRALRLDRQLAAIGKRATELLDLLSRVNIDALPFDSKEELLRLSQRIRRMATVGQKPVLPSIEAAQKAAGISANPRPRRSAGRPRKAGYKPKL